MMSKEKELEEMTQIQLIDGIIEDVHQKQCSAESIANAIPKVKALAEKMHVSTNAALIFTAFVNSFDDPRIQIEDLAKFFDCNQVRILTYWDSIEELVHCKYIDKRKDQDDDFYFTVPYDVMMAVRENRAFTPKDYHNMDIEQWIDMLSDLLNKKNRDRISYQNFVEELHVLIENNKQLTIARELSLIPGEENQLLFIAMMDLFIQNNDNHVMKHDVEDLFENTWIMRHHARQLERGDHFLQNVGLIEHSNSNGQVESDAWMLTPVAKKRFLSELDIMSPKNLDKELKMPDKIVSKKLYFNASVSKQLRQLEDLLQPERFTKVQDNLVRHGMRKGFACIFYGSPGTGKTETVLQLARQTARPIMQVDVPNLRSKWVGDTEKNTKAIFERYRSYCNKCEVAPILLFNEADAVLCKRNEGATTGVDKMENAMQNIFLQEMEDLDGIMIATTNLTGNLDAAFERRFLYKIEFPKPTPDESKHIWKSMLPDISEDEAYELARQYSFSGGQIENIARKQLVHSILSGEDTVNIACIREACDNELLHRKNSHSIGFC